MKILLVDDEKDIAYVLKQGLDLVGFSVDSFTDPIEAVRQFKPAYYDAVITDIRMPNMNGFELYRKIREADAEVRVYFVSAYDSYDVQVKKEFASDPLVSFIKKPTTYRLLAEILNRDLEKKQVKVGS